MKVTQKAEELNKFVQAVLSEQIKVGEVIRQTELCEVLNTSMSPLRELIVLLEELDLIEVKPRSGFKIIYPDIEFWQENMQFRVMIEMHAMRTFIEHVDDGWISDQILLHQNMLHELETKEDLSAQSSGVWNIDRNFHRSIVTSLNNRTVTKAHEYTQTKLRIARQVHRRIPPRKSNIQAMQDHLVILEVLKSRDVTNVLEALDDHFTKSIRNTLVGY